MQHSPFWEANRLSASQEIPRILRNPKVHYRSDKSPPPLPALSIPLLTSHHSISPGPRLISQHNTFLRWAVVSTSPNLHAGGPLLSAVRDLFNIFAPTVHIGGRSSIRNLRTRHAVVTRTHLSHTKCTTAKSPACFKTRCHALGS